MDMIWVFKKSPDVEYYHSLQSWVSRILRGVHERHLRNKDEVKVCLYRNLYLSTSFVISHTFVCSKGRVLRRLEFRAQREGKVPRGKSQY